MFRKVLIPLDGSKRAEEALGSLGPLLSRAGSQLVLLKATGVAQEAALDVTTTQARRRKEAELYLGRLERRLKDKGWTVKAVVREGSAADVILGTAAREKATLILMTTHGRTGLARWIFGSVAESVLREATIPVLVLRAKRPAASRTRKKSRTA